MYNKVTDYKSITEEIIEALKEEISAIKQEYNELNIKCDVCNKGKMIVKRSRNGSPFLGCDQYPECKNTKTL